MTCRAPVPFSRSVAWCVAGLLASMAAPAEAQIGSLRGIVRDFSGRPLEEVVVLVDSLDRVARTDRTGRFYLDRLPKGEIALSLRRLGFEPRSVNVFVTAVGVNEVFVTMQPVRVVMPTVSAIEERRRQGIDEFHQRRQRGLGTYITRAEILERNARVPSDMLRTVPGIRFVRARSGSGIRFVSSAIIRRDCLPMMWIDGTRAPEMEIDDIPVSDIEGIELYQGPSTTPMQFSPGPVTTCGTIVVWTRQPG